ncbi:MAG: hypothetical protein D6706_13840, partial [Chloroflexi bacterium]
MKTNALIICLHLLIGYAAFAQLPLTLQYTVTPDCNNRNQGVIHLNISGGVPPYQYQWHTGDTVRDLTGLPAGIWAVTVTDDSGATVSQEILVPGGTVEVDLGNDSALCRSLRLTPAVTLTFSKDSLRIVYDATKGMSQLQGVNKVYMHAGAEIDPFGGWQYVTGNWGQDDGIGLMDSIGPDLWEIVIQPATYFNYPYYLTLNGIFMVFRNADGTLTGKDDNGNDIFLYTAGPKPTSTFSGIQGEWVNDSTLTYAWHDGSTSLQYEALYTGTYMLTVTNALGCSASDTVHITTATVSGLDVTRITPNSARLLWQPSPLADGYQIRGRALGAAWRYVNIAGGSSNQLNASGLPPGATIEWQIRSYCDGGSDTSAWSVKDTFQLGCQAPDSIWADPVTPTAARLNWKRVIGAVGYEIRGKKLGGPWVNVPQGGGTNTSKEIFSLQPNTTYVWKVRAWCDNQGVFKSNYSVTDTFTTPSSSRLASGMFLMDHHGGKSAPEILVYPNPVRQHL